MKNIEISQLTNFDIKKPTYMDATFALSKFGQNFPNRFLKGIGQKFLYPQNQHKLFNQLRRNVMGFYNPGIQLAHKW